jgi:hypothetical protein
MALLFFGDQSTSGLTQGTYYFSACFTVAPRADLRYSTPLIWHAALTPALAPLPCNQVIPASQQTSLNWVPRVRQGAELGEKKVR